MDKPTKHTQPNEAEIRMLGLYKSLGNFPGFDANVHEQIEWQYERDRQLTYAQKYIKDYLQ
jgi:hypothetical protein